MSLSRVKLSDPTALRGYAHPLRMSLVGLLRQHGPMTATQAAARLGESVPNCSFHLRQLAKYGLAERVPGADARERPWRATAMVTSWDDASDDPVLRAATDELTATQLAQYTRRAEEYLARRAGEPAAWRAVTGFSDLTLHLTPDELGELTGRIDALLAEYEDRITDPTRRPPGSRKVSLIHLALLPEPAPAGPEPAAAEPAPAPAEREPTTAEPAAASAGPGSAPASTRRGPARTGREPAAATDPTERGDDGGPR
ncbi:winged helix-turn-helix domain-containing protein [Micromonospora sp. C28SCA-DRY-2]|uniref:winged helix-turn-helix domain-containing protein n=1 Tax=Micromonospora sp. C28SCA-DRY-2 TaxID=3059522 RepID=UPI0034A00552